MKYLTSLLLGLALIGCEEKQDDADGDGYSADNDCDDSDETIGLGTPYSIDDDGDGFGSVGSFIYSCSDEKPPGYATFAPVGSENADCNDTDAAINPGTDEVCADDIDNDCDGLIDAADDDAETITAYADRDADGFGAAGTDIAVCELSDGFVDNADDCNDSDADINPDAAEVCDGIDNDCDADVDIDDSSVEGANTVYADTDLDGFGDPAVESQVCDEAEGWVSDNTDCNDIDATVNPEMEEVLADGIDQNCDAQELCYEDLDGDGFGSEENTSIDAGIDGLFDCELAANASSSWSDCDDNDSNANPSAVEVCDGGIDNDCDSLIDDLDDSLDATTGSMFYADLDQDGYGSATEVWSCEQGANSANWSDCNDSLASSNPMATDITGDAIDQNCDGVDGTDSDLDGHASTASGGSDCDDWNIDINPDAQEICDGGIDNDCDSLIDDLDDSIDTSGTTTLYEDYDEDGFGSMTSMFYSCASEAPGWISDNTDCDDWDGYTFPGAAYNQSLTGCLTDADMDGWSSSSIGGTPQVCYDIQMEDSYGDGWNGNAIEVYDDGVLAHTFGLTGSSESQGTDSYCVEEYSIVDFYFMEGSYTNEISFEITNSNGDFILGEASPTYADGELIYSETAEGNGAPELLDCDDWDPMISPDATEVCDGMDNNCDAEVDEGLLVELYPDWDGDGFGSAISEMVCEDAEGYVDNWDDCDDTLTSYNPLVTDIAGDGYDQNCDGSDGTDYDGDGFVSEASGGDDCDDWDATTFPGAAEIDAMMYGLPDVCMKDSDDDGFGDMNAEGAVEAGSDCEDEVFEANIDGAEIWYDGIDGNCDGMSDFDQDMDGDDIDLIDCDGDGIAEETECDLDGDGELDFIGGSDCNDLDINFNGFVAEIWLDGIDQNCDNLSDFDQDMDGDNIPEIDCFGILATECDVDGDGVIDFIGGSDCDDLDENLYSFDLDADGFTACEDDCDDSAEDDDGDGIADSSYTYPGAAYNEDLSACLTDVDGDGYAPMTFGERCFEFITLDSYGDGWNGNEFHIYENGLMTGVITNQDLDGAGPGVAEYNSETFCLQADTSSFDIYFIDGTYNNEISFQMFDQNEDLLAEGNGGDSTSDELTVNSMTYVDGDIFYYDMYYVGMDCDDSDAIIYAGSDYDADGFFACIDDCDDYDSSINSGATESFYDGIDQACDGNNDFDQDGDGDNIIDWDCDGDGINETECDLDGDGELDFIGGTDCDDSSVVINGLDYDMDGMSVCDGDCNDWDIESYLGADQIWYDGIDQSCIGLSDFDQDMDGFDSVAYGGTDCDDLDTGVGETDEDGDGSIACIDDCNDDPNNGGSDQFPGNAEVIGDGIDQDCDPTTDPDSRPSCSDHYDAGQMIDGIYSLMYSDGTSYDAYCDMTIDGGGWTRIVGTDSSNHDFGQITSAIVNSYVAAGDTVGVSQAFMGLESFSQIMIMKTSDSYAGEFAAYDLVESISGQSVMDILQYCSSQPIAPGNDNAWDGARVVGYTSHYSGMRYTGSLMMGSNIGNVLPEYFFMCGVNESSDNDQSVMAFTDMPGNSNWWGDSWRGEEQNGAMWSFWNGDYHYSETYHIGNNYAQGYAGYKTYSITNTGSYEVFIR